MIHIGRAGARLGSFSEDEVRQGLVTGRFSLTDLGWKEGMDNWAPLSQFSEFEAPPPAPPLPEEPVESAQPGGLPWEHRQGTGLLAAFVWTAQLVLTNPQEAFARMRVEGSLTSPLLYNLIGGWFGMVMSGIYIVLTSRMPQDPNPSWLESMFYIPPAMAINYLKLFIVMGPVMATLIALISGGIAHLFLMLAGGANKPFHVTLRVFCFSYGSTQLLQVIPIFGGLLAPVWFMVCCVMGLAAAHGTTTGRALAAMALFVAALCACCIGSFFLALGGANLQSLRPMLNQ